MDTWGIRGEEVVRAFLRLEMWDTGSFLPRSLLRCTGCVGPWVIRVGAQDSGDQPGEGPVPCEMPPLSWADHCSPWASLLLQGEAPLSAKPSLWRVAPWPP